MREALVRGCLPPDFLRKLGGLAAGDLGHRFIEQNCRLFVALLLAVEHGCFRASRRLACERLLRVLAYVRKDNDAIADYQAEGFTDDRREVRAATEELADVLQAFKEWRLRFQVPAMWPGHGPGWGIPGSWEPAAPRQVMIVNAADIRRSGNWLPVLLLSGTLGSLPAIS